MDGTPPILRLPTELLQRIARYVDPPVFRFSSNSAPQQLLHLRQTCRAIEKASFNVLVERYPRKLRYFVGVPQSTANFKSQTSQLRLALRLKQITLAVDELSGSNSWDISTVENEGQDLEAAQAFDRERLESNFYGTCLRPLSNASLLSSALKDLQALAEPPSIDIFVWLSEEVYLEHDLLLQNSAPMLSSLVDTVPPQMLRSLHFAYVHCDAENVLRLIRRSHNTLEAFNMDNVSLISSEPQWTEALVELARCTKLKKLFLCNLREECFGELLSTREPSSFSPHLGYLLAGFTGLEEVSSGLRLLIEAELSPAALTEGYEHAV